MGRKKKERQIEFQLVVKHGPMGRYVKVKGILNGMDFSSEVQRTNINITGALGPISRVIIDPPEVTVKLLTSNWTIDTRL